MLGCIPNINAKARSGYSIKVFVRSLKMGKTLKHGHILFAPAVLEFVSEVKPDEIKWIAELFEIDVAQTDSPKEIAEKIGVAIATLAMEMGLKSIDAYEPEPEKLYQIIERAKSDVMTKTTPRPLEDKDAKWIIDRTYEIHRAIHQEPVA